MQITIKTLKNEVFKIESEIDVDVAELKKKVEEHDKNCQAALQKLIYQGKIMEDGKKLSDYNITEKGFIVLMLTKAKPAPKPVTPEPKTEAAETPTPTETPAAPSQPAAETPATPAATPAPETPSQAPPAAPAQAAPMFSEEMVNNIAAMGFPRDQIVAALRAAFGNPDRAVDYLMNGIPENLLNAPAPAAASPAAAAAAATPTESSSPTLSGSELERIRNEPQFQQIRQIIRTNPQLLQQFIQQMSRSNPEFFRMITENQEGFIRILNEPDASDTAPAAATGGAGGPAVSRDQEGRVTLQVTEEERQAIDRLKQLGFPEEMVIQAYFACEKNEELAANFLLSNAFD